MKMRCWRCKNLNYDYFDRKYETPADGHFFCGLHGRAQVDPDGEQVNLDRRGGCGYYPKEKAPVQLTFDFRTPPHESL
jgi:hypothetical protein